MIVIHPGMSFGDFLMQEVPDDWEEMEEYYWQPTIWTRITTCRKCGNPCSASIKWMRKQECLKCPD